MLFFNGRQKVSPNNFKNMLVILEEIIQNLVKLYKNKEPTMQHQTQKPKHTKSKLQLKSIQTKSRYLVDKEPGLTPLTCLTSSNHNHPSYESLEAFKQKYELLGQIGQGANGVVYKCRHKKSDKIFAVKKSRTDIEMIHHVKSSYNHTKMLQHNSIIHYKGLYICPQKRVSYLVMEYFEHPQLCSVKISEEKQISKIAYQLLEAVAFMHEKGICHRDIKPDNILYDQKNRQIKVTDFGESKATREGRLVKQMMTCTGTLQYKAPELFRGGVYDQLIDEWAVGVTIYELLTGKKPFDSQYKATIIDNIENFRVSFQQEFWAKNPRKWAKKLILQLLSPRQCRITAEEALKDLWFDGHASALKSITINPKNNNDIDFKNFSMINGKPRGQELNSSKMSIKSILKPFQSPFVGGEMIDSEDQYVSDEDEELFEDVKPSNSNSSQDGENIIDNKKIQATTSSTECKSPLCKEEDQIKSPLLTQSSSIKPQKEYSRQC